MKFTVVVTENELKNLNVDKEKITDVLLEHVDSLVYNGMKIFHQTEIEVEVKISKKN